MHALRIILQILLFTILAFILYVNRSALLSRHDAVFWKDKYEQSQWFLPLSTRTIGDDGLYLAQGYQLIRGSDPTMHNAEAPPFGKYLIGASVILFQNGHWFGVITMLILTMIFIIFASTLYRNTLLALGMTSLLLLDPLIITQFPLTMLDGLQAALLLWYLLLLHKISSNKSNNSPLVILAGIILGLFSATKFPILAPFLFIIGGSILWRSPNRIHAISMFTLTALATYSATYTRYFLLGHTLLDWLHVQKWIVTFYTQGLIKANTLSVWTTLLANSYQNLFSRAWERIPEWNPVWMIATIGFFIHMIRMIKSIRTRMPQSEKLLILTTMGLLLLFSVIPFWSRYLVLALPLLYLLFGSLLRTLPKRTFAIIMIVLLSIQGIAAYPHLFPTPENTVRQFIYDWRNHFFQDMYTRINPASVNGDSWRTFHERGLRFIDQAHIEVTYIDVNMPSWSRTASIQSVPVKITHATRSLGRFSQDTTLTVRKIHDVWKIDWDWDMLIAELSAEDTLVAHIEEGRRGSIIASDKKPLAEDFPSYMVWVTPQIVDRTREAIMLKDLEILFDNRVQAINFHHRYVGNRLPSAPVPLGVIPRRLTDAEFSHFTSYPGLSLKPMTGRYHAHSDFIPIGNVYNHDYFECCSFLYSTTSYDGENGVEKEKNDLLKGHNGGSLVIMNPDGTIKRTILTRDKQDGQDVQP